MAFVWVWTQHWSTLGCLDQGTFVVPPQFYQITTFSSPGSNLIALPDERQTIAKYLRDQTEAFYLPQKVEIESPTCTGLSTCLTFSWMDFLPAFKFDFSLYWNNVRFSFLVSLFTIIELV